MTHFRHRFRRPEDAPQASPQRRPLDGRRTSWRCPIGRHRGVRQPPCGRPDLSVTGASDGRSQDVPQACQRRLQDVRVPRTPRRRPRQFRGGQWESMQMITAYSEAGVRLTSYAPGCQAGKRVIHSFIHYEQGLRIILILGVYAT